MSINECQHKTFKEKIKLTALLFRNLGGWDKKSTNSKQRTSRNEKGTEINLFDGRLSNLSLCKAHIVYNISYVYLDSDSEY